MVHCGMITTKEKKSATSGRGKLVKVRGIENLYRYTSTGVYYACYYREGRTIKKSLRTDDRLTAKQALAEVLRDASTVDHAKNRAVSVLSLLELHMAVRVPLMDTKTQEKLCYIRDVFLATWPNSTQQKVRDVRRSDVERWVSHHRNRLGPQGKKLSKGTVNEYILFLRALFQTAVDERFVARSPVEGVKNLRRDRPIRRTPTMSDFRRIVADLRGQVYNAKSGATADFVEFIGLSGLGNGEAASLRWGHLR